MEFEDLLAQSVWEEKVESEERQPDWVSEDNASFLAWNVINQIKKEKFAYISKHKTASKFRTQKTYQVQKSEVAEAIGATTQALFYASSYSTALLEYLEGKEDQNGNRNGGVNGELLKRKEARLAKSRTGLASKTKKIVYAKAQSANKRVKILEAQNADEQLALAIKKLPLNVRAKLELV